MTTEDQIMDEIRDVIEGDTEGPPRLPETLPPDDVLAAFPRLDLATLLSGDTPDREWVVEQLLPAGAAVSLVAEGGTGKSLLALALSLHVPRGRSFAGLDVPRARRVLYVDCENSRDDLRDRLRDLGETPESVVDLDNLTLLHLPDLPPLDTASGGSALLAIVDAYQLEPGDLVVLDSQQRVTAGPENDSDTQRAYYRHTGQPLKKLGLTVLRTDNTGKNAERGARGSSGKRDDVDLEWMLAKADSDGTKVTLRPGKTRLPDVAGLTLAVDHDDDGQLSYSSAGDPFRALVDACARELDRLGLTYDAGYRPAMDALTKRPRTGAVRYPRAVVRAAVKARQGAPRTHGAPPGAPSPGERAGGERRTPAHPTSAQDKPQVSTTNGCADDERRTYGAPGAAVPAAGAPPLPPYRERRTGAPNDLHRLCEACSTPMVVTQPGQTNHPTCTPEETA